VFADDGSSQSLACAWPGGGQQWNVGGPSSQNLPRSVAEIRVDIDAKHFPAQKVDDKVKVELRGEVEKDFMETPEIDVDVLIVLR